MCQGCVWKTGRWKIQYFLGNISLAQSLFTGKVQKISKARSFNSCFHMNEDLVHASTPHTGRWWGNMGWISEEGFSKGSHLHNQHFSSCLKFSPSLSSLLRVVYHIMSMTSRSLSRDSWSLCDNSLDVCGFCIEDSDFYLHRGKRWVLKRKGWAVGTISDSFHRCTLSSLLSLCCVWLTCGTIAARWPALYLPSAFNL